MYLADLTWEEAQNYLNQHDSLIIPIGICEQHSKHLPLNTDTLVADYIARYLSEQTGMLIAPTFPYGVGLPCDRIYAGSSSILYEDVKNTLTSLVSWWKLQGFQKIFLLSAHGDTFHIKALQEIKHENVFVLKLYDMSLEDLLEKQRVAKHAAEAETSVMLYLFPDKVRSDKIEDFETPFEEFELYRQHLKDTPIPSSPGCQGYPSYATKEKGEKIVERMKEYALTWIQNNLSNLTIQIQPPDFPGAREMRKAEPLR